MVSALLLSRFLPPFMTRYSVKTPHKVHHRAIFMIRRAISSVHNVSVDLALSMFDKRISPVLLFGCPIWGVPTHKFSIKVCIKGIPEKDTNAIT